MPAFAQLTEPLDCLADELVAGIANYLVKEPSLDMGEYTATGELKNSAPRPT